MGLEDMAEMEADVPSEWMDCMDPAPTASQPEGEAIDPRPPVF